MSSVNWSAILHIIESIARDTGTPLPGWAVAMKNDMQSNSKTRSEARNGLTGQNSD